ncbi:MAG: TerB family tellurite resistance protein [Proteobacteria bacterium]|nr:TerB family tellurite resistance protein [Pseudomonadota bacterium]
MLTKLQQFFDQYLNDTSEQESPLQHRLQLASAALMVEVIHADDNVSAEEEIKIQQLLKQEFDLDNEEMTSLLELAHDKKHEATDYYHFTSLLNTHYTQEQKIKLVENLWRLAYADHQLDKFEEHLIRRLAELLHVPHQDFIRSKHKVLKD